MKHVYLLWKKWAYDEQLLGVYEDKKLALEDARSLADNVEYPTLREEGDEFTAIGDWCIIRYRVEQETMIC